MATKAESKESEEDFRLHAERGGQRCEVYFFARWSGYSHPVRPVEPVRWVDALLQRAGHCQAWMCEARGEQVFAFFRALNLVRTPWTRPLDTRGLPPGDAWFAVARAGAELRAGPPVTPAQAAAASEFLHATIGPDGSTTGAELVHLGIRYTYEYTYGELGALVKTVVRNDIQTTIFERGKEPVTTRHPAAPR